MSRAGVGGLEAPRSPAFPRPGTSATRQSGGRRQGEREMRDRACVFLHVRRGSRRSAKVVPTENSGAVLFTVTRCRRLSNAVTAANVSRPLSLSTGDLPCQLCPLEEIHSDQQRVSVNQAALLLLFGRFF